MDQKIARFNERITIQKNTVIVDRNKNHMNTWVDYFSCFSYASTYQYDKEEGRPVILEERTIIFNVRWCSELKDINSTQYRIIFHGSVYNITNVDMMNYQRKTIKIRCVCDDGKGGVTNGHSAN